MNIILFGNGQFASLAWYCLTNDTGHAVSGFTVDREFIGAPYKHDLPVVDFDMVEASFPPDTHRMLLPVGPSAMNELRRCKYFAAKAKGYEFATYISARAIVWPDLEIGESSMVSEGAVIQPFARIGVNTLIRSGSHIAHHCVVGDHCFVAAKACIGGGAVIREGCFVGLNATIRDGITIAERCLIAAGAVVHKDTEPNGVYLGVPARRSTKIKIEDAVARHSSNLGSGLVNCVSCGCRFPASVLYRGSRQSSRTSATRAQRYLRPRSSAILLPSRLFFGKSGNRLCRTLKTKIA